jgi:hypothetical protein
MRGSNAEPACSGQTVHFRDFSSSSLKNDSLRPTLIRAVPVTAEYLIREP